MKKLFLIIVVFFLSGCVPYVSPDVLAVTQTAHIEASNLRKTQWAQTQEAIPTRTPGPTATEDLRSPFDKCAQSGVGVRYVVFGQDVNSIDITQENDNGGTEQGTYKLPYCQTFRGFSLGEFLYISAQIESGDGKITCRIYYLDTLVAEASSSGEFSIATCSGRVK